MSIIRSPTPGEPVRVGSGILSPDDLGRETLVLFPRSANPPLHERVLGLIEAAGYRFESVREAADENGRGLMLAVAGGGVALSPTSLTDAMVGSDIVVRRPLDPPISMPDTLIAWRANPPRQLRSELGVVREVARSLWARLNDD